MESSTQKAGKWHSLYDLHIKERMAFTLFCLHALLRKAPETVHIKTGKMSFALFLCGRFRRALHNNACIDVQIKHILSLAFFLCGAFQIDMPRKLQGWSHYSIIEEVKFWSPLFWMVVRNLRSYLKWKSVRIRF